MDRPAGVVWLAGRRVELSRPRSVSGIAARVGRRGCDREWRLGSESVGNCCVCVVVRIGNGGTTGTTIGGLERKDIYPVPWTLAGAGVPS